jgi:hypothetical protein
VFRNVGNYKSDAGESPKRTHTISMMKFKNAWNCNSVSPYVYMTWCLVKQREREGAVPFTSTTCLYLKYFFGCEYLTDGNNLQCVAAGVKTGARFLSLFGVLSTLLITSVNNAVVYAAD